MSFSSLDLCGPDPRQMTCAEIITLKEIVGRLPFDPIIVQIGAERGTSTLAILEERPDCFIFSVDIGECQGETENLIKAGLDVTRVVRVLGKSQVIGTRWPYKFDMLFVDGDHSEAGVRGDIDAWIDKIKPDGIIVFHDYIQEPIPDHIKGRVSYAVDGMIKGKKEEIAWTNRLIAFKI